VERIVFTLSGESDRHRAPPTETAEGEGDQ
jgi:hypothetical protein